MRPVLVVALISVVAIGAGAAVARPAMTRSQAAKIARTSNLKASDRAGYDASPSSPSPGEDIWGGRRYARCANRKAYGKDIADRMSPTFEHTTSDQFNLVASEVEVMPRQALAAKDIRIAKSSLGRKCLRRELVRLKQSNSELQSFNVSRLGGFNNGVAYRMKMVVKSQGIEFPYYIDLFAFAEREVEGAVVFA